MFHAGLCRTRPSIDGAVPNRLCLQEPGSPNPFTLLGGMCRSPHSDWPKPRLNEPTVHLELSDPATVRLEPTVHLELRSPACHFTGQDLCLFARPCGEVQARPIIASCQSRVKPDWAGPGWAACTLVDHAASSAQQWNIPAKEDLTKCQLLSVSLHLRTTIERHA